jgi:hypothetical protein
MAAAVAGRIEIRGQTATARPVMLKSIDWMVTSGKRVGLPVSGVFMSVSKGEQARFEHDIKSTPARKNNGRFLT